VVVALALNACSDAPDPLLGGSRRDLLLDSARVQLLEGFGEFNELVVWKDFLQRHNIDRDELPLLVTRNSRLVWQLGARALVFKTAAARYHLGGGADVERCTLTVTALADGRPMEASSRSWNIPLLPADPGRADDDWYEGAAVPVLLLLPEGAQALEISVSSKGGPGSDYVTLLSPHVEYPISPVGADHVYDEQLSLLPAVPEPPEEPVLFGRRTTLQAGEVISVDSTLPAWEVTGAFEGKTGRHALALTGERSVSIEGVEIRPGDVLSFGVALDHRLPENTRARVEVAVTGNGSAQALTLLGSVDVHSKHWQELRWPVGEVAGENCSLVVSVSALNLPAQDVEVTEPDFGLGDFVAVRYRPTSIRVGLSNLALTRSTVVPWRRASTRQPSVVLVHIETLRADRLSLRVDDGQHLMPSLDALARLGTNYTRALAPSPWTLPSTATLLTGLPPTAHGVVHHNRMVLPDDVPTLAERAREVGVATGAVLTNDLLDPHKGYSRGFDHCAFVPYANARQVGLLAGNFLDDMVGRQFLLLLHYWDPHHPYRAPNEWRDRFVEPELKGLSPTEVDARMYAALKAEACPPPEHPDLRFLAQRQMGDVAYLDHHLGLLLDRILELGLSETTTVVVTADHGEEFGEQGWYGHGSWLFDECTRVPLVIAQAGAWGAGWVAYRAGGELPGGSQGAGVRVDEVVSTSGLHAEVLKLLDVPFDRGAVRPALSQAPAGMAFVETHKGLSQVQDEDPLQRYMAGLRASDRLVILAEIKPSERESGGDAWTWHHYELLEDGAVVRELPAEGDRFEQLQAQLMARRRWAEAHHARPPAAGTDADAFETLRKIGYVGPREEPEDEPMADLDDGQDDGQDDDPDPDH
jgi:hypothetical protein